MAARGQLGLPYWTLLAPALALVVLALAPTSGAFVALIAIALIASVFASVHHAEVVAHRVGEPYGTLVLALAVTVIESSLIVSMLLDGGPGSAAIARDTVFATVMIVCNGVVGLCLVVGTLRHRELVYRVEGTAPALSVLAALTGLTLVLPGYTLTTPGPTYSAPQLVFAGVLSLVLYAVFVFVQTVRHRDYFLPVGAGADEHAAPPSRRTTSVSLGVLVLALVAVVGLAKALSPALQALVTRMHAPAAVVGVMIALLVLMPETLSAVRAAARDRMQTSINLTLGSALATIGLTIPTVAAFSLAFQRPLELGSRPSTRCCSR
jgi:Ca2+:H+ antiporter